MLYAMKSIQGKREQNEDCVLLPQNGAPPLVAVFDGMGGHRAGNTASATAARLVSELSEGLGAVAEEPIVGLMQRIEVIVQEVNARLFSLSCTSKSLKGMGTTMVLAFATLGEYIAANVGDSRLYHYGAGNFRQVTRDHSYVADLVDAGIITCEQAHTHPARNIITRALGTNEQEDIDLYRHPWAEGDILLLCTDGLYDALDEAEMRRILEDEQDLEQACDTLVKNALYDGSTDNISVILLKNRVEE